MDPYTNRHTKLDDGVNHHSNVNYGTHSKSHVYTYATLVSDRDILD